MYDLILREQQLIVLFIDLSVRGRIIHGSRVIVEQMSQNTRLIYSTILGICSNSWMDRVSPS